MSMLAVSSNFNFLAEHDIQLARLGALAERYFHDDAPAALIKLRQLAEFLAKEVAARHAVLPSAQANFDDTLRALKLRSAMPREVADLFYHLKKVGNAAAHENTGTSGDVLTALKMARGAAIWFHRTYGNVPAFKPGPFVPPAPPVDATAALQDEIRTLQQQVRASADAEAKAQLAKQEAEAARLTALQQADERQQEKQFWEQYAAETEAGLLTAEAALKEAQRTAESTPIQQLDLLAELAARQADKIELDEATTRVLIDDQLRAAGWDVDSAVMRHANGTRPEYGRHMAIAEWPTKTGPVDYALFIDGRCVGVVEAKREVRDVPGRLGQAKRYAVGIDLTPDELPQGGPWQSGDDRFRMPFLFVTNGRPYVKQLATKSGIWFWDARPNAGEARALPEWLSPRDLVERLEQETEDTSTLAEREIGVTGPRPYQQDAIAAVEKAVGEGQRHILLAMATGTGKTRLAIALMYELLRRKRFRRILFLVDRNALGRQTLDAMSTTDTSGFLKFDEVFPVADLAKKFPEATDRVQVATVQAMIRRVFDDPNAERPTPGTYDLIIVDEAHRGYTLDAELREDDLGFRNLDDYLSAYRRVLDFFDATKVALTATPALHTREIFGAPVFHYSYRQAVIDGYTISGKDYYRCAGQKERGTCGNTLSVRKGALETAALSILQHHLFTEEHAKLFTETFNREVAKISGNQVDRNQALKDRLAVLDTELGNLSINLLSGVVSATLTQMLVQRETEKADIEMRLARTAPVAPVAQILPHPELVHRFAQKVGALRETLDDEAIRAEASDLMDRLIESVTIYPDGADGPEAEVVANVADLAAWAINDNAAPWGGVWCSTSVVAGAGFEPATFRL